LLAAGADGGLPQVQQRGCNTTKSQQQQWQLSNSNGSSTKAMAAQQQQWQLNNSNGSSAFCITLSAFIANAMVVPAPHSPRPQAALIF
jgi:hypothetical protein